jgi:hypothetical protein
MLLPLLFSLSEPNYSKIDIQLDPTFIDEKIRRSKTVASAVLNHYAVLLPEERNCRISHLLGVIFATEYNFEEGFFEV